MPKPAPLVPEQPAAILQALGDRIRARRKALRVSATAAAEAAGVSRVTLHRIEKGEPSVTMGAWVNVVAALDMQLQIGHEERETTAVDTDLTTTVPVRIPLADYPQLKALAWQVQGTDTLTPVEALDIYERNARHLEMAALTPREQALWNALQQAFARGVPRV